MSLTAPSIGTTKTCGSHRNRPEPLADGSRRPSTLNDVKEYDIKQREEASDDAKPKTLTGKQYPLATIGADWLTVGTGRAHREEAILIQLKGEEAESKNFLRSFVTIRMLTPYRALQEVSRRLWQIPELPHYEHRSWGYVLPCLSSG